jgi:hypothetical protein
MAGDWIKWMTANDSCPEVVRLSSRIKRDTLSADAAITLVCGALVRLWSVADAHVEFDPDGDTDDGYLFGYTLEDVDRVTAIRGFGEALVEVGWAQQELECLVLIGFAHHNGKSAKTRITDTERRRRSRSGPRSGADPVPEASRDCPGSSVTEPGPEKRREEKRREKTPPAAPGPPAGAGNPTIADLVERVRLAYPRKVAPDKARAAIEKAARRMVKQGKAERVQTALTMLQARAAAYAASPAGQQVANGDKDIRPYPATWFNQGRYEDDQTEWLRPNGHHHQTRRESPEELADRLIRETEASERGRLRLTGGAE